MPLTYYVKYGIIYVYDIIFGFIHLEVRFMKNSKKIAVNTKKAFQTSLMAKAAAKKVKSTPVAAISTSNDNTTTTLLARKVNEKAFQKYLAQLLADHPAIESTKTADFKAVLNMLLKLNVDLESAKSISVEAERVLNIFGFTNNKQVEGKDFIPKDEIPMLVKHLFSGYQEKHPDFCEIDPNILLNCNDALEAISQKVWHPAIPYIACQSINSINPSDASKLLSGNAIEIESVFDTIKCTTYTRNILMSIAPELGHILQHKNDSIPSYDVKEKTTSGYFPFSGLNPADFPSYIEEEQSMDDSGNVIHSNVQVERDENTMLVTEPVMQEQQPSAEDLPLKQIVGSHVKIQNPIESRQVKSFKTLSRTINAIKQYGDLLRQLDKSGFSIDDARSFVEAENIGFNIHEMLTNKATFDSIAELVTALS